MVLIDTRLYKFASVWNYYLHVAFIGELCVFWNTKFGLTGLNAKYKVLSHHGHTTRYAYILRSLVSWLWNKYTCFDIQFRFIVSVSVSSVKCACRSSWAIKKSNKATNTKQESRLLLHFLPGCKISFSLMELSFPYTHVFLCSLVFVKVRRLHYPHRDYVLQTVVGNGKCHRLYVYDIVFSISSKLEGNITLELLSKGCMKILWVRIVMVVAFMFTFSGVLLLFSKCFDTSTFAFEPEILSLYTMHSTCVYSVLSLNDLQPVRL